MTTEATLISNTTADESMRTIGCFPEMTGQAASPTVEYGVITWAVFGPAKVTTGTKLTHQAVSNSVTQSLHGGGHRRMLTAGKQFPGRLHDPFTGMHSALDYRVHV